MTWCRLTVTWTPMLKNVEKATGTERTVAACRESLSWVLLEKENACGRQGWSGRNSQLRDRTDKRKTNAESKNLEKKRLISVLMSVRCLFIETILDNPNHAQAKLAHFITAVLLNCLFGFFLFFLTRKYALTIVFHTVWELVHEVVMCSA